MSQQFDELARDPQVRQWLQLLSWGLWTLIVLTLVADFVLFARWLLARRRQLQQEAAQFAEAFQPVLAEEAEGVAETIKAETNTDAPASTPQAGGEAALPQHPSVGRLWQWSPVHVFVGGQIVILLLTLMMGIGMAAVIIPVAWRHLSNPFAIMDDPGVQRALTVLTVIGIYLQNVLLVGVVVFFLRRYGDSLPGIGLGRPRVRQIVLGVGLGLAVVLVSFGAEKGLEALIGHLVSKTTAANLAKLSEAFDAGSMFTQLKSPVMKLLFLIGGAIAAPIGEEVFFRGFLYNALKSRYGVIVGIIVSGLIFALVHISPLALLIIFPMGMFLAYVYERTRSLWVTISIHAVNNGLAFALLWLNPKFGK